MDYDKFRETSNRIDIIRNYYRNKYKNNGKEMPWWIGEKPASGIVNAEGDIRLYSTASREEKDYLKLCGFILFPDVLDSQYGKLALWLCSRHSIVNPSIRDMYSAGGQMNVFINNKLLCENISKCICNFLIMLDSIRIVFSNKIDVYNEISYYSEYYIDSKSPYTQWKAKISRHFETAIGMKIDEIMTLTFVGIRNNKDVMMETISDGQRKLYSALL